MISQIIELASGYQITLDGATLIVPADPANRHYQMVQAAIAGGAEVEQPPAPNPVPSSISKVQFVRAARAADLWATYQAAIEAHPDWPYVTEIPRNDPIVQAMASQLGFTEQQLDALWIAGAAL